MDKSLRLKNMAIGSLPHTDVEKAMQLVCENFNEVPFWPQLTKLNKHEDMILQFLDNMPSLCFDKENNKTYLETESDIFFENIEQFYTDYSEITLDINSPAIDKYAIKSSSTFEPFINILKELKPQYAKGQIVGPFTLATTLVDRNGKCAFYDETLREIIVKTLSLKALWQIKEIKSASENTTPIIFIDEPSISQLGTSAFITISKEEVTEILKEISDLIKSNGAISAIHCCGKCDWNIPINAEVNIINLDAYNFAKSLSLYHKEIELFLEKGNKIAWGVVPTLDTDALIKTDESKLIEVFDKGVKYLTNKGINEKIVIDNSIITPSCGAGSLTEDLAEKAMQLTRKVTETLKERYTI